MQPVTIYTKPHCPYCVRAKTLLDTLGVSYEEIDVIAHPDKRAAVSEAQHWFTVPMIFIGDEFIGGFDDLLALQEQGKLEPKLHS